MTDAPDWRRRRWEATHERIFTAAVGLFEELGFDQVSVGAIATASGVSVPTFYAHYPSKEHLVMRLTAPEQVAALIAAQPLTLPLAARIRRAAVSSLDGVDGEHRAQLHARWQIIAGSPALRHRAGEFDRITATMVAEALADGGPPRTVDLVVASAYMAAYTTGLLAWADSGDATSLEECVQAAFDALEQA
ncbi:TetR/AcrR family transcriptional regulator [Blastococcus sp. VKM Ac-2987]|uniref:TetR/AcrR family transcriptional regulator n=1 Tax=Blastococcus sp. VKM Ac-2987 TaxID=3004141 RepID=UPI0022AB9DAC|nr:TetR/AcrR family transcriptional regulator [Blastococcus sp. VKM Ac-2987]MCZ2858766.1 TetR/AcrR family transcriptional regulator [Blastococcus sp. VKM Ac-2987]